MNPAGYLKRLELSKEDDSQSIDCPIWKFNLSIIILIKKWKIMDFFCVIL